MESQTESHKHYFNKISIKRGWIQVHYWSHRWMSIRRAFWSKFNRGCRLLYRCDWITHYTNPDIHTVTKSLLSKMVVSHCWSKFRVRNRAHNKTSPICSTSIRWLDKDWYKHWLLYSWRFMDFQTQSDKHNLNNLFKQIRWIFVWSITLRWMSSWYSIVAKRDYKFPLFY